MDADAKHASEPEVERQLIAYVSSYGGLGGSEVYLERLLSRVDRSSVGRVVVLGEGPLADRLRESNHTVDIIPTTGSARSLLASSWGLRRLLRSHRPDVVHANGLKAVIVAVLATSGTMVPVVWVRHDFSFEGRRARALARLCRGVVCVSGSLTKTFRGTLMRKVTVVYTGMPATDVDREQAHLHALKAIGGEEVHPIIVLVGQLVPWKGHRELIEISAGLREPFPDVRIVFIGGSPSPKFAPYEDGLKELARRHGTKEIVTFLGHRDDALALLAGSDIAVMPSVSSYQGIETEGFPLLALESLMVGTPIVAYRVGGLPESVGDCGLLVEPGDKRGLLDAIIRVVADPILSDRMSMCGRERVTTRFSMEGMVIGLQRAYEQAMRR